MKPATLMAGLIASLLLCLLLLASLAFDWRLLPEWQMPCPRQDTESAESP